MKINDKFNEHIEPFVLFGCVYRCARLTKFAMAWFYITRQCTKDLSKSEQVGKVDACRKKMKF